jgi:transcriptional regulator NrdR family protein
MKEILKRNGQREELNPDKIKGSIESAANEAGYPEEKVRLVLNRVLQSVLGIVQDREEIKSAEIRETILKELDERFPEISAAWRNYDKVKTSK